MNKKVDIYVLNKNIIPLIHYVQYSTEIPIEFQLMDYIIPQGAAARYYIKKPSGLEVYNECQIQGNSVILQPTAQTFAESGKNQAQIQIIIAEKILVSFILNFEIEKNIITDSAIPSSNEFGILDSLIQQAQQELTNVSVAVTNATNAAARADAAAQSADDAAEKAITAAGNANSAAQSADSAKDGAVMATVDANDAAEAANEAAEKANAAADLIPNMGGYILSQGTLTGGWRYYEMSNLRKILYITTSLSKIALSATGSLYAYDVAPMSMPSGFFQYPPSIISAFQPSTNYGAWVSQFGAATANTTCGFTLCRPTNDAISGKLLIIAIGT